MFRPASGCTPPPALMYRAAGLSATYPTVRPSRFVSGVTSLPTRSTPLGLTTTRSVAPSRFRLESRPLWTVAHWGDSAVYMPEITQPPTTFFRNQLAERLCHGTS